MTGGPGPRLLVVAGETSGDLHGARLLAELTRLVPGLAAFGLGSGELRAAGLATLADSSEVAVVGIAEVLRVLPRARRLFAELLAACDRERPAAALLVDFPEFNLRLARELAGRGIPVVYYVSPQVWAWRRGRVRSISRTVARMLTLFPFEAAFYRAHGVDAVCVGHPLVDEVPQLPHVWERGSPRERGQPFSVALLPGSRASEVAALLPTMVGAAEALAATVPVSVRLVRAPGLPDALIAGALAGAGVPVEVCTEDRFAVLAGSHLALCASGTATLELGLLGTPMIVLYRLSVWTYLLGRLLVRLPHISLVNLVAGRDLVPEMVQGEAHPLAVAGAARGLLDDPRRIAAVRAGLAELRGRLGEGGASARAAAEVARVLAGERR